MREALFSRLLLPTLCAVVFAEMRVPELYLRPYPFSRVREADVNIGLFVSIHQLDSYGQCSTLMPSNVLRSWAMDFAVNEVNTTTGLIAERHHRFRSNGRLLQPSESSRSGNLLC
jgi:hypothetical protein